jgi:hypothetical protein
VLIKISAALAVVTRETMLSIYYTTRRYASLFSDQVRLKENTDAIVALKLMLLDYKSNSKRLAKMT